MRTFLVSLLLPVSLAAADPWIHLTTPHFEMYTTAGENKGREAILYFEEVRSFFLQASPSKNLPDLPVRIVAFRGEKEYKPYRINEFALAFYTGNQDRDYIVMQDISSEHYPAAIHEYAHLIINHSGLKLPIWMNEGWAELYSTLRPMGNKARIGDMKPGWLQTLTSQKWLPLQTLTAADHNSPYYNERDKAGIFYAQSWALMHMLYFDDAYRPHFNQLVAAVASGKTFAQACETVLGVPIAHVEKNLKSYFTARQLYAALVNVKLTRSEEEATAGPISDFDSSLALADLLVVTHKKEQATRALNALAAQNPTRPELEESLGYLAWQEGDARGARDHFGKAVAEGTKSAQVCYRYALMEHSAKSLDALRRAVNLNPAFMDAWMQLGLALIARQEYQEAVSALKHITTVKADQASQLFSARAYALVKTDDLEQGRKNAEDAQKWARTPNDIEQAASILRYLDAIESSKKRGVAVNTAGDIHFTETDSGADDAAPKLAHRSSPKSTGSAPSVAVARELLSRVEGTAQNLECNGKQARISIRTDRGIMKFDIPDPERVTIRHASDTTHDFTCGPQQNYRIAIEYLPAPDSAKGVSGVVRALEF